MKDKRVSVCVRLDANDVRAVKLEAMRRVERGELTRFDISRVTDRPDNARFRVRERVLCQPDLPINGKLSRYVRPGKG